MQSKEQEELLMDEYVDHLIRVMQSIDENKVTVLTGRNGGGKSMIRKLLHQFINKKIASVSMDDRAGVNPERMSVFDRDCEWLPTSENTLSNVLACLKEKDRYIILDEIELGLGEELQAGLAMKINDVLKQGGKGVMIITHSREIARRVNHDVFINLEGMTEEEWLNRSVTPLSPDEMTRWSGMLYRAFQKRLKKS